MLLPQRIYLDANVLLPALAFGHPFFPVYNESIKRLVMAAEKASIPINVMAHRGFLNEVVSHRRLAREAVASMPEPLMDNFRRQASAFGSANMNVFLGAYANVAAQDATVTFDDFLRSYAPYENENDLADWLQDREIQLVRDPDAVGETTIYGGVYQVLEALFADELAKGTRNFTLLRHDAIQLSLLEEDRKRGLKSLFVSADRRLREHIGPSRYSRLANSMVSHVGLAQLIDLLVGSSDEHSLRALGRLLWSAKVSSDFEAARSYLVDRALQSYDEALAMSMGEVVDRVASAAAAAAKARGIHLAEPLERQRAEATKLLEDFENELFSGTRDAIERRRREPPGV